ncbi:MAG: hypothetical protein GX829_11215 [Clostridium sp.]|nr:hypothetical protein [Clostridium sp.]
MTKKRAKILRKLNNMSEKNMSKESNEVYTDMILYLRFSDLTLFQQETVRNDFIQMILDGEQRGENIQMILGGDYKTICDEIINSFPPRSTKDKFLDFLSTSSLSFSVVLLIFIFNQFLTSLLFNNRVGLWTFDFLSSYLVILPLSFLAAYFVAKNISKTALLKTAQPNSKMRELTKIWIYFSIFIGITLIAQYFLDSILFQIPMMTMIAVVIMLLISHILIEAGIEY